MPKVQEYHTGNLRFTNHDFTRDCINVGQLFYFRVVGVYHQNSLVDVKMEEVWYGVRTILLHVTRKWPKVICIPF